MRTSINPDISRLKSERVFQHLGERTSKGLIDCRHGMVSSDGKMRICPACHPENVWTLLFARDLSIALIEVTLAKIADLLRIRETDAQVSQVWMTEAGLWHRAQRSDELIHSPFPGRSAHEVLEAIEAAEADPRFGCGGFGGTGPNEIGGEPA